ncbi:MAG: hypothetical protein U0Y10_17575 [Spirosomataceae bacterium]
MKEFYINLVNSLNDSRCAFHYARVMGYQDNHQEIQRLKRRIVHLNLLLHSSVIYLN